MFDQTLLSSYKLQRFFYYLDIYLEMQYNVTIQKGINQFRAEGNEPETGQKIFITTSHKKM